MSFLLVAVGLLLISGTGALLCGRSARLAAACGCGGVVAGSAVGFAAALRVLLAATPPPSLRLDWAVPGGAFSIALDPLSSFFLLPTFALSALAAVYGGEYPMAHAGGRRSGSSWFFFNLLVASMVLVIVARNAVLFLMAWEIMSLASFFLVTFEDERPANREAGWTYLVAAHLGTACLVALFLLLGRSAGSLDFESFAVGSAGAGLLFLLALAGFGTKAGLVPLHVWLPEAHPAAPSHVSAVMSGVMLKVGLYGLLRTLSFLGPPAGWWGVTLVAIGLISGLLGALFALAQRDLKRLLAYSSVENVGIVAIGLGVGLVGTTAGSPPVAALGFCGALVHVVNHAAFKGLLFLGAGAVAHATGTRNVEQLGGLLRRMPRTAATFLVGAAAISALPPLNGFVGELLIYLAAFHGASTLEAAAAIPLLCAVAGLALIGGLAVACFTRAFGIVFCGEPRSAHVAGARDPGLAMQLPMLVLASACLLMALLSPAWVPRLGPVLGVFAGPSPGALAEQLTAASRPLLSVVIASVVLVAFVLLLGLLRASRGSARAAPRTLTWDCGYAEPTPRMQYTASSFAEPLISLFAPLLRARRALSAPRGIFPAEASLETSAPDVVRELLLAPLFAALQRGLWWFRGLQQGRVQVYVLYIVVTLLALLIWQLERLR